MNGWLIDEKKINNSFMLIYVNKAKKNIPTNVNDIINVECILVTKQNIINYLNSIGWTKNKLMTKMNNIRYNDDNNMGFIKTNGCKFAYSKFLYEKPINVIIPKTKLKEISEQYFLI